MYTESRNLLVSRFFVALVCLTQRRLWECRLSDWIVRALDAEAQYAADAYYSLRSHGNAGDSEAFDAVLSAYEATR